MGYTTHMTQHRLYSNSVRRLTIPGKRGGGGGGDDGDYS